MSTDKLNELLGKMIPEGRRVIGTYLYPNRIFGDFNPQKPEDVPRVITKTKVEDTEVYITGNGGLFYLAPEDIEDANQENELKQKTAEIINQVICEFALNGIISAPATPTHISVGYLFSDRILVMAGGGGPEIYNERTIIPILKLFQGNWIADAHTEKSIVEKVSRLECTSKLVEISSNLPTLIAGAYSLFSQCQYSESLIDSWIVIEQILDYLWSNYCSSFVDVARKDRLSDTRTYSASVRIEILHSIDLISKDLYISFNRARKNRNDLAHRARISLEMANECIDALRQVIEEICGQAVYKAIPSQGVYYLMRPK